MVWVLCGGGFNPRDREKARLLRIDPISFAITFDYEFKYIEHSPTRLNYNITNQRLYFINRAVYSFPVDLSEIAPTTTTTPSEIFKQEGANFYGLGIDAQSGNVIVTDAKDYSKKGIAYVLSSSGQLLYDFETGVIPQDVVVY